MGKCEGNALFNKLVLVKLWILSNIFQSTDKMDSQARKKDILADLASACIAAFAVSPTNAILDRSVIEYANGKETLQNGVKGGLRRLFTTPISFFTSFKFRWMYFVYSFTYSANNLSDHVAFQNVVPIPIQNLLITFSVNTACGILKDKMYIQHFGASAPKAFPVPALFLLFFRDLITMAAAFTLPPIIAKKLQAQAGMSHRKGLTIAQLSCPLAIQLLATPLHLLGLDLYNRQGKKFGDRLSHMKGLFRNALIMRMIRFLPAYGLGGVINNQLRRQFKA